MPVEQISVSPLAWGKDPSSPEENAQKDPISSKTLQNDHDASETSTISMNYDICRICHCEGDSEIPLIAPCYCSGSLRYVHQACLQQWIKSSDIRSCELCKFQFIMQSKLKPFNEWENLEMSPVERRKLFCSVSFHVVALTCVVWSLYVLIDRTVQEIDHGILEWPFWTKLIVVAIGFTGGIVFMYIQCKAYMHLCRRWKAFNRVIFVQNAPEKQDPSLHVDTCCGNVLISTTEENINNPNSGSSSLGANNVHLHHHHQSIEPILLPTCNQNPRYDLEKNDHDDCGEMIHLLPKELVVEITPEAQSPLLPSNVSIPQIHPVPNRSQ